MSNEVNAVSNKSRRPTHPGVVLAEACAATGLARAEIARRVGISRQHLYALIDCHKPISPAVAARIGRFFGNGSTLWLRMQIAHDLWEVERDAAICAIKPFAASCR